MQKLASHIVAITPSLHYMASYLTDLTSLSRVARHFRDHLVRIVLLTPIFTTLSHELEKDRAIFGPFPVGKD